LLIDDALPKRRRVARRVEPADHDRMLGLGHLVILT
jgi:hypothetical protein